MERFKIRKNKHLQVTYYLLQVNMKIIINFISFLVHIMYYKLNAASEEAKELLTQKLCETFLCHNWGPYNSNNEALDVHMQYVQGSDSKHNEPTYS